MDAKMVFGFSMLSLLVGASPATFAAPPQLQLTEPGLNAQAALSEARSTRSRAGEWSFHNRLQTPVSARSVPGIIQLIFGLGYEAQILDALDSGARVRIGFSGEINVGATLNVIKVDGSSDTMAMALDAPTQKLLAGVQGSLFIAPTVQFFDGDENNVFGIAIGARAVLDSQIAENVVLPEVRLNFRITNKNFVAGLRSNFDNDHFFYIQNQLTF